MKLLMISGKSALDTALGKKNAFYNTLEELHKYFERIDIVCDHESTLFGNVFFGPLDLDRQYNVMTVHEYAPFRNGWLAKKIHKKTGVPYILEIMHIPGMPKSGSFKEFVAKLMTRFYIKRDTKNAVAVRVINTQVGDWLEQRGIQKEKIKLVPAMYIDLNIFKNLNLEKKYDLLFVGRRAKNKGISLFEFAANKLTKLMQLKKLVIDGWAKDSSEIARLMNESKILVAPSYNEGGPRVVLEALACGIHVLATPVGIVPEVLPREFWIDWSPDDIAKKAKKILAENPPVPYIDLSKYEKKTAIKNYAEFIDHYAKS